MIKIVYRNLSPGLHASAEAEGRNTVISFLPGLTPEQRRAALRRIRHSGRMGHGPGVPGGRLAIALTLDRVRAGARTCTAVVRQHPAGSTLPVAFFSAAAVIFVLMATVSIHVLPTAPRSSSQGPAVGGTSPVPGMSAPVVGQRGAPSWTSRGTPRGSTTPGRLAARQLSSGTSATGSRAVPSGTHGSGWVTGPGSGQATGSSGSGAGAPARAARAAPARAARVRVARSGTGPARAARVRTGPVQAAPARAARVRAVPVRAVPVQAAPARDPAPAVRGPAVPGPVPVPAVRGPARAAAPVPVPSPGSGSGSGSSGSGGGTCVNVLGIVQACVGL